MSNKKKRCRLVTRSDFEGVVCAILLKEMDLINNIKFANPKDVQDGKIKITGNDILANLPYVESAHFVFDHHSSETIRIEEMKPNHIIDAEAPSTAGVIYNYFGGKDKFPNISDEMMAAADKVDAAQYTMDDVLHPKGWELLSFIMDSRSGLGRFRHFRISNYELMIKLIVFCRDHTIDEILEMPDVKDRTDLYFKHESNFKEQAKRCATIYKNLAVLDLRNEEIIYCGNRFMIYALFPECNISMQIVWGHKCQNTVFAVGKSIFNRSSKTDIGELMLKYGGGGHSNAGTCQIDNYKAQDVLKELIDQINTQGLIDQINADG